MCLRSRGLSWATCFVSESGQDIAHHCRWIRGYFYGITEASNPESSACRFRDMAGILALPSLPSLPILA